MNKIKSNRLWSLDFIRGLTLISMIIYHATWDLVNIYRLPISWYYKLPGFLWQQSICWCFILLSGFCWRLGHHPLKRGLTVFVGGLLVTIVTLVAMPENRVVFGVLTLIGSSMLLMIPVDRLTDKINPLIGSAVSFLLFLIFREVNSGTVNLLFLRLNLSQILYNNLLTTYLGFPSQNFFSTDYFSIIPWFFLFATGHFLNPVLKNRLAVIEEKLSSLKRLSSPFQWIGKHSLIIYLLHQPVIYAIFSIISLI